VTTSAVVELLNEMHRLDSAATAALVSARVPCNDALAGHPTVQVGIRAEGCVVGLIGVINGILGMAGEPLVCSNHDDATDALLGFSPYAAPRSESERAT
jgi:hypothetical protein